MSHLATIKTEIKDIEAVKALCTERGWTFMEGQTSFLGMGWRNQCSHAIKLPGVAYEVGLTKTATGYTLGFDDYLAKDVPGWNGGKSYLGKDAGGLMQGYAIHKTMLEAKRKGWLVTRKAAANGAVKLVLTGM